MADGSDNRSQAEVVCNKPTPSAKGENLQKQTKSSDLPAVLRLCVCVL